ncbi:MAG TPA: aminotransferase class V-fold PLP-dependent enzyme [Candidatus Acidoferrales bacterium]|nr:aminotransferase class V-fold PLP-dependent enzyme [Candidatus Acidoferrales bacterium]
MTTQYLTDERAKFVVDDDVAYFNTAALSPVLSSVRAAAHAAVDRRSQPWTIGGTRWFDDVEDLRSLAARLLGVAATHVAFVPATSYGLAAVARNLSVKARDRVLVLDGEFPSNYYTWHRFARRTGAELVVVQPEAGQTWADAIIDAVDERVAIASLPNVHWTNGRLIDLNRVAPVLRAAGSSFIIDASQSFGAMPLDVATLKPDAIVSVGYKWLLGPYSLGYLYLDEHLHDGEPLEENWIMRTGSEDFSSLIDYWDEYRPGAQRFDVGERSNFQLVPMATAAIQQLLEWTVPRIAETLQLRTNSIAEQATALGLSASPPEARGPHMLGVELPRAAARQVAAALDASRVVVSARGSSLRIAPHLHTSEQDIERLMSVIASAL